MGIWTVGSWNEEGLSQLKSGGGITRIYQASTEDLLVNKQFLFCEISNVGRPSTPKHTRFLCCIGQIHAASTLRILQVSLAWSQWVVLEALLRASRTWVFGIDIKHQGFATKFQIRACFRWMQWDKHAIDEWIMSLSITYAPNIYKKFPHPQDVLPREGLRSGDVLYEKSCIQLLGQSFSEALGLQLTLAA